MSLSSGTASLSGTVSLALTLASEQGNEPAAVQWTLAYPAGNIASIAVSPGAAAASAGKTANCNATAGAYTCLITGLNNTAIPNGIVAVVDATMAAGVATTSIGLSDSLAALASGTAVAVVGSGGMVTGGGPAPLPTLTSLSCTPASLSSSASANCSVVLSAPAAASGAVVAVSDNSSALTAPTSVTVAAGSNSATFTVTAGTVTSDQSATVTAVLNGSTKTSVLSLVAPVTISSLACTPTSLGAGVSSSCVVSLSKATGSGTAVALSDDSTALSTPSAVSVTAGAGSATFTVTAGSIATDQSATVTATLNGSTKTAVLNLVAPVALTSLVCTPATLASGATGACTATLNKAATSGATVALSDDSSSLSTPVSVTVASGAISATFSVTAGTLTTDQTVTITATLNDSSKTAVLSLSAPVTLTSLSCTPTSLGSAGSSACTVTVSKATASATAVTLSDNSSVLNTPSSVTVAAGATSAIFSVTTGGLTTDQSATVTATLNGSTKTTTLSLTAPVSITSLACVPSTLASKAACTCTATVSKAVTSGTSVALSNNNASLTAPPSVTVESGATSATFSVTAGTITTDQSATITATLNGSSQASTLRLVAPLTVTSLNCAPTILASTATSACTATVSKAAASATAVTLSDNSSVLITPSSVTVAAGASSASFSVSAGTVSTDQSATVTATLNGSSKSATLSLVAPAALSSLTCTPTSLASGAASSCIATLSKAAAAAVTVALSSNNILLPVLFPAVTIPAGSSSASFTVTAGAVPSDQTAVISAVLNGVVRSVGFNLFAPVSLSSFTCNSSRLTVGSSATCTVTVSKPSADVVVALFSRNSALLVPPKVTVPAGASQASFFVTAQARATGWLVLSASLNGSSKVVVFVITATSPSSPNRSSVETGPELISLSCGGGPLPSGSRRLCQLSLTGAGEATLPVELQSSDESVNVPLELDPRPGESFIEFEIQAQLSRERRTAVISAQFGTASVSTVVEVIPQAQILVDVASPIAARYGAEVRFHVSSPESALVLPASALPSGAYFNPASGDFSWTPAEWQQGSPALEFTTVGAAGEALTRRIDIHVGSGSPVAIDVVNAASRSKEYACSPGGMASINGRWLTDNVVVADPTGQSRQLGGATVLLDGAPAPLLFASPERVDFLCPDSVAGAPVNVRIETPQGISGLLRLLTFEVAPAIFSLDGSGTGQALVRNAKDSTLAMVRNPRYPAKPARSGEEFAIYATGLGRAAEISARVADVLIPVDTVVSNPERPGVTVLLIRMPEQVKHGNTVGISLRAKSTNGIEIDSPEVSIAVAAPEP